jgi:hypothetical protein
MAAERARLDARQGPDAIQQFLCKTVALLERRIPGRRQRNAYDQHAIGVDPGVHLLQDEEGSDGQRGAGEQDDRQGHFDHDKEISRTTAMRSRAGAAGGLERVGDVGFRRVPCGREAEEHAGQQRHTQRKQQHGKIDRNARFIRHVELGHQSDDRPDGDEGKQHAERAARQGEQHALGQQLTKQPPAAGPDRNPDGNLARPGAAAGQLQVCHVGARDEEQERDRAEQEPQTRLHLSACDRHVQIVPQRRGKPLCGERRGLFKGQLLCAGTELLLGDLIRHAGRQPHDGIDPQSVRGATAAARTPRCRNSKPWRVTTPMIVWTAEQAGWADCSGLPSNSRKPQPVTQTTTVRPAWIECRSVLDGALATGGTRRGN